MSLRKQATRHLAESVQPEIFMTNSAEGQPPVQVSVFISNEVIPPAWGVEGDK